jgi:undecaprenyl-diphosphatase
VNAFLLEAAGSLDEALFRAINLAGLNPLMDFAMLLITALGVEYILGLFVIPLWFRAGREAAFDFVVLLGITVLITIVIKYAVGRPRPCEILPDVRLLIQSGCADRDPAFPSGHASRTFAFAGFVFLRYRWRAGVPAFAFATLVGLSRIYLGLHWPSDVFGGALLGIGVAVLVEHLARRSPRYQRIRTRIVEWIPHVRQRPA